MEPLKQIAIGIALAPITYMFIYGNSEPIIGYCLVLTSIPVFFITLLLHETLHYVMIRVMGIKHQLVLSLTSIGFRLRVSAKKYIVVALAPQLLSVVALVLMSLTDLKLFFKMILTFNILLSIEDFVNTFKKIVFCRSVIADKG